jgi:hypothetical protein
MKQPTHKILSFRIEESTLTRVRDLAAIEHRSMGSVIRIALYAWLSAKGREL